MLLVDHAERAQSVEGVEKAEIVQILDHHHIGSIETKLPVTAIFDPVGSTATLVVIERFRQADAEPTRPAATMLLGVIVSDTVLLTSPTTTERDRVAARHLERQLELDAKAFGRELLAERAFGKPIVEGAIELPGVVSRKKQVAPVLLAAAGATV